MLKSRFNTKIIIVLTGWVSSFLSVNRMLLLCVSTSSLKTRCCYHINFVPSHLLYCVCVCVYLIPNSPGSLNLILSPHSELQRTEEKLWWKHQYVDFSWNTETGWKQAYNSTRVSINNLINWQCGDWTDVTSFSSGSSSRWAVPRAVGAPVWTHCQTAVEQRSRCCTELMFGATFLHQPSGV